MLGGKLPHVTGAYHDFARVYARHYNAEIYRYIYISGQSRQVMPITDIGTTAAGA